MTHSRFACLLLTTCTVLAASAQDSAWQRLALTPDVAIFAPGDTNSLQNDKVKAINAQISGYFFQLKYLTPKFQVKNGDELVQAYDGFLHGYLHTKEISIYTTTASDTSLNGTFGEWIHSKYSKDTVYQEMYSYLVLVNSHFYMVTLSTTHPVKAADPIFSRYFASLQFPNKPIKEHSGYFPLQARSYRNGQHIGRSVGKVLPWVLGILIAGLIFFFVIRAVRQKKNL